MRKLFKSDQINKYGLYGINFVKNGISDTIIIDDYIPCINKTPVFSRANGNELWVILLEKAWAKVHGSYNRIIGGLSHQTFRDVTGAPSFEYETS